MNIVVLVLIIEICEICDAIDICDCWRIEVDKDRSGNVFFSGGCWSRFLTSHGVSEGDALLLRYEGNMVFTVKVFGLDGCQKGLRNQDVRLQELGQTEGRWL